MARRALIFDLDDTLYPERRFALSGYAAVAARLAETDGVPARESLRVLVHALAQGHRATAFQRLAETLGIDPARVADWVETYRQHSPRLRLPRSARRMLVGLRQRWSLGLVTNGLREVQQRKVEALGVDHLVDGVVLAGLTGQGGKPAAAPFLAVCEALSVSPARAVFVGDDLIRDVLGARRVGMKTIRLGLPSRCAGPAEADVVVERLDQVPEAAERLLQDA